VEEEKGVHGRREIYLHFCTVNPAVIAAYIRGRFAEPIAEFDFSRVRACAENETRSPFVSLTSSR